MSPEDKLAKQIKRIYRQASREVRKKLDDFIATHKVKNAKMLEMVRDGRLTEAEYKSWLRGQVFTGERWSGKLKDITNTYVNADAKAREIIGGTTRNVFIDFANKTARDIEHDLSGAVSFDMYDFNTVRRLLRDDPMLLPKWKINLPKDYIWNEKRVQNAVTQGIIQGESITDIGQRLCEELSTSNASKMDMFARTAVTGAENAGRIERLRETEEMGIEVRKKWLSAHDDKVRDTHAALDGQERPVNEPFEIDGMTIDHPGDPSAPPELVYNCRCTLTYVYPKYERRKKTDGGS